jgi:hypothetical protein
MKKFSEGGKTSRADAMRDRRMADIDKDYQKALRKGKSEKEAQAKRDQRIADAKDDYAKRTGADRTETRAAEKAAEARLTASRRSPDKDMKPAVSAVSTVARATRAAMPAKADIAKADTPKAGAPAGKQSFSQAFAAARKDGAKTFTWNGEPYTTEVRGEKKPATPASTRKDKPYQGPSVRRASSPTTAPASPTKDKPAASGKGVNLTPFPPPKGRVVPLVGVQAVAERRRLAQERETARKNPPSELSKSLASVRKTGGSSFAKGGKIDGAAIRGKTKLKRNK